MLHLRAAKLASWQPPVAAPAPALRRMLAGLVLFGMAFGYVEASVVVYLRALIEPIYLRAHPAAVPNQLFPLLRLDQLQAEGQPALRYLATELCREAATLLMLAGVALAITRNFRQWFAAFVIGFGVWDIFYYVFLKVLLDWPASLLTWDLLFLLPVPWVGPVLAPVLVALAMVGAGVVLLAREAAGRPIPLTLGHWMAIVGGGLVMVLAFCWDYRNILAGGEPNPFQWPLFLAGLLLGLVGFLHGVWRSPVGEWRG